MNKRKIIAVWAEDEKGLIGKNNHLPWKKPEDLKHFKETTINKTIVMGSKTFEGLEKKALPNRTTIVLSQDLDYQADNVIICHSIEDALNITNDDLYIVGGKAIYRAFAPHLTNLIKTEIKGSYDGDTYIDDTFDYSKYELENSKELSKDAIAKYYKRLL